MQFRSFMLDLRTNNEKKIDHLCKSQCISECWRVQAQLIRCLGCAEPSNANTYQGFNLQTLFMEAIAGEAVNGDDDGRSSQKAINKLPSSVHKSKLILRKPVFGPCGMIVFPLEVSFVFGVDYIVMVPVIGSVMFDHYRSRKLNIYEMKNGYSEWSIKYFVNLDNMLRRTWKLPKDWDCYNIWSIFFGEREEDLFMVIGLSGKVLQYKLGSKTVTKLLDLGEGVGRCDRHDFIASFAHV
nr:hypothetical protein [Tanacetum cinerariifolium]